MRHLAVDILGLILMVVVLAANWQDQDGGVLYLRNKSSQFQFAF